MDPRKIKRGMTSDQAMKALSGGSREALTVCKALFEKGRCIDPDDFLEGWGPLRDLDALGIRGVRIVRLFRDVCDGSLGAMIAVLRAWQLGIDVGVTPDTIKAAIDRGMGLDLELIIWAVKAELPNFDPN